MIDIINEMLSFPFMVRAIVVGSLTSICASLLGVNLVLKRYSMIGDGLSHVGFGALAVALVAGQSPLPIAIAACVLASFFLLRLSENSKLKGDAAIALVSASSLAAGVMMISVTSGINTDVCNFMFGTILAMNSEDANLGIWLIIAVIIIYVFFYHNFFLLTFDEEFAKAAGRRVSLYKGVLSILVAITVVVGMRMMGALMISSLLIFPAISAIQLASTYRRVTIISVLISLFCFFVGMYVAYVAEIPAGATIVLVNLCVFIISALIRKIRTI